MPFEMALSLKKDADKSAVGEMGRLEKLEEGIKAAQEEVKRERGKAGEKAGKRGDKQEPAGLGWALLCFASYVCSSSHMVVLVGELWLSRIV